MHAIPWLAKTLQSREGKGRGGRHGKGGKKGGKGANIFAGRVFKTVAEPKRNFERKVCHQKGHWAGDPERPGSPRYRQTLEATTEAEDEEGYVDSHQACLCNLTYDYLREVTVYQVSPQGQAQHPDTARGVLDTACGKSVAGELGWKDYRNKLDTLFVT